MAGLDFPITRFEDDDFARGDFAKRLVNALVDKESRRSTGHVIGLKGEWGAGKSSILNLVRSELNLLDHQWQSERSGAVILVEYNPWLVRGTDALIAEFFSEFINAIEAHPLIGKAQIGRKIVSIAKSFGPLVATSASTALGAGGAPGRAAWDSVTRMFDRSLSDRRIELREFIARARRELGAVFVVTIDELDRIEDDEVRSVAQLIKAIADFPEISYLLAYDRDRVTEALGSRLSGEDAKSRGSDYLQKIVQIEVSIPPILEEELIMFLDNSLRDMNTLQQYSRSLSPLPEFPRDYEVLRNLLISNNVVKTPRHVKRLLGHFSVLHNMLGDRVDWWDVLALSALETLCPTAYKFLEADPALFTVDTVGATQLKDIYISVKIPEILDKEGLSKDSFERFVIDYLFPIARTEGAEMQRPGDESPYALNEYGNLILALRRGTVPGGIDKAWFNQWLSMDFNEKRNELLKITVASERGGTVRFANMLEWEELDPTVEREAWNAWFSAILSFRKKGIHSLRLERAISWPDVIYHTTFRRRLFSNRLAPTTAKEILNEALSSEYASLAAATADRIIRNSARSQDNEVERNLAKELDADNIVYKSLALLDSWKEKQNFELSQIYEIVRIYLLSDDAKNKLLVDSINKHLNDRERLINFCGQTFGEGIHSNKGRRANFDQGFLEEFLIIVPDLPKKVMRSEIKPEDYPIYLREALTELTRWAVEREQQKKKSRKVKE